jgi:glycine reductase complex component B subunit gamma
MTQVATTIGSPRIIPGISVLHPTGDPALNPDDEQTARRSIMVAALKALTASKPDPVVQAS